MADNESIFTASDKKSIMDSGPTRRVVTLAQNSKPLWFEFVSYEENLVTN